MNTYHVVYFVRKIGAIGKPEKKEDFIEANNVPNALEHFRAKYEKKYDMVQPFECHLMEEEKQ